MADTPFRHYFVPVTLSHLGVRGVSLTVSLTYADVRLDKVGWQTWLTKLPKIKDLTPVKEPQISLDLDLSCVALDAQGQVIDVVWYGKLRNDNDSLRHGGDALRGATTFEENFINQEEIQVRLAQLADEVVHLLFFVSSFGGQNLSLAKKGVVRLSDNEDVTIDKLHLDEFPKRTSVILVWAIQRVEQEFLVNAPLKPVTITDNTPNAFAQALCQLAQQHINPTAP